MIPCLYNYDETEYTTNGIGKLADAVSCVVTEKRNSSYELEMEYPADGIHADSLIEGNIILAKPADNKSPQPFRIYKVTTPLDGKLEVSARHISYQLNYITVSPMGILTGDQNMAQAALDALKENATTDCPFTFETDVESDENFTVSAPNSIRNCLGGIDGSVLDTYGGEYEWDFYTVRLHESRGADNGVRIVYGKNLIDFKMNKSIENTITGVHPYWQDADSGDVVELPEKIVELAEPAIGFQKIMVLDCSEQFEEEPTESQLRSYAESYLEDSSYAEPDVDIDIDFLQLWQQPGYEDIAEAERVSLCDTVHVYIVKLGIEVSARVTETEYDSLLERYNSITLSNSVTSSRSTSLVTSLLTVSQAKAMISMTESAIRLSVAKTYVTSDTLEEGYSTTVETKALIEESVEAITLSFTETLTGYSTTEETTAMISASADALALSFSNTIADYSTTEEVNALISASVEALTLSFTSTLSDYSTTEEITSMIQLSADSITLEVATTLSDYTKTSEIRSQFAMDSTSVTIESGVITFSSNSITIDSDNFQLSESGEVSATGSFTSGDDDGYQFVLSDSILTGYYNGEEIGYIKLHYGSRREIDNTTYNYAGITISADDILLSTDLLCLSADTLAVKSSTSSYYAGCSGTLTVITEISQDSSGNVLWNDQEVEFYRGIMVTDL